MLTMNPTYLNDSLKDGLIVRWPDEAMPIKVYVAPFKWYEKSKQQESYAYNQMVYDALERWSSVLSNKVRFAYVANVNQSQIDISWRRINRKSLGHCEYMFNQQSLLYSAEIKIGISDGIIHHQYNDMDEVRHTILHEIGHALGILGHSDGAGDIMYVPHQYGVTELSKRDIETINALYSLPPGFDYQVIGQKHQLKDPFSIDDVLNYLAGRPAQSRRIDFVPPPVAPLPENPEVLLYQNDVLSQMGRFNLATQNIKDSSRIKKIVMDQFRNKPLEEK
jgi:predicted Zn-dependent protease